METKTRGAARFGAWFGAGAPFVGDILAALRLWARVRRERRALASLDARLLRDIGLHEADARMEVERPFWDLPNER